jgi:hypothetical protein
LSPPADVSWLTLFFSFVVNSLESGRQTWSLVEVSLVLARRGETIAWSRGGSGEEEANSPHLWSSGQLGFCVVCLLHPLCSACFCGVPFRPRKNKRECTEKAEPMGILNT